MLTFDRLRATNLVRVAKIHPGGLYSWDLSDWLTALVGEIGEAANIIKKINRIRDGGVSNMGRKGKPQLDANELLDMLRGELADAQCYLDLLSARAGFALGDATVEKFNQVSEEMDVEERL